MGKIHKMHQGLVVYHIHRISYVPAGAKWILSLYVVLPRVGRPDVAEKTVLGFGGLRVLGLVCGKNRKDIVSGAPQFGHIPMLQCKSDKRNSLKLGTCCGFDRAFPLWSDPFLGPLGKRAFGSTGE